MSDRVKSVCVEATRPPENFIPSDPAFGTGYALVR
jgi:hypothetical protein